VLQLLKESDSRLARWRERIMEAVGTNGGVLTKVIPELELIVGAQPAVIGLDPQEAQNRFDMVFSSFIRALSDSERPLVLFLDDLQWVDTPSLRLIELIMGDGDVGHLLLIGAYRDHEVEPDHPLNTMLDRLQERGLRPRKIRLTSLGIENITQLVADAFQSDLERVTPLGELIYRKTAGNPFFARQILNRLHDEEYVTLSKEGDLSFWSWDIDSLRDLEITENVIELLVGRIQRLPLSAQRLLELAACIGSRFDWNTLFIVAEGPVKEFDNDLRLLLKEGLIERDQIGFGEDSWRAFRFQHDRIQQAAYSLIEEQRKPSTHLRIGRLLSRSIGERDLQGSLFLLVNQFNKGLQLVGDRVEKIHVAELNLRAAEKAKSSLAYDMAARYLDIGIQLAGSEAWTDHHDLIFELHKESAECHFLAGAFSRSTDCIETAMLQCTSDLEQARLYIILLTQKAAKAEYVEAIALGIRALSVLGINLPAIDFPHEREAYLWKEVEWFEREWAGKTIRSLADLPVNHDLRHGIVTSIMATILDCTIIGAPDFLEILTVSMVNYFIKHGNTSVAPLGYLFHAVVQSVRGDYEDAFIFGEMAIDLNETHIFNQKISAKFRTPDIPD